MPLDEAARRLEALRTAVRLLLLLAGQAPTPEIAAEAVALAMAGAELRDRWAAALARALEKGDDDGQ